MAAPLLFPPSLKRCGARRADLLPWEGAILPPGAAAGRRQPGYVSRVTDAQGGRKQLGERHARVFRGHPGSLDSWRGICSKSPEHDTDHGEAEECTTVVA